MQKPVIVVGIIVLVAMGAYVLLGSQSQNNTQTQTSNLKWHTDLNSAIEEAKKTNKPIFVDFYTTWCIYCKQLDETTLSDSQVQEKLSNNYVVAKIDADKNPNDASKYKIYGYPTLLFLDSNGGEIKRIEGYVDSNTLLNQF